MAVLKHEMSLDNSKYKSGLNDAKKATQQYKGSLDGLNNTLGNTVSQTAKFQRETKKAQDQVQSFEKNIGSLKGSLGGMISSLSSGDFMGFASNIKNATMSVKGLAPAFVGATGAVGGTTAAVGGLGAAINLALGPIGLAVAAIGGLVAISAKAIKTTEEFNKNLKDLSALTGMTGKDLEEMGDMAKEMGLKFGTSANDIVQSMMLIGSQAPELLKDKEALAEVTEAAIVLSKAAGIEVTDAAKGLTTVMNQMGVSADEATNIINALAAGSQQGAGDVAYLQTAIEKCGTVAADSGMSYQQLIGTIETLAPKFSSADVAGSALKGTLLKLTTQANDDFNPAVVGISKALENLDKANLSAADKVKMFGDANVTAASILIKNREALDQLTEGVTGTNTAYEQMETKGGQLAQLWDKLCVACENFFTTLGKSYFIKELGLTIAAVIVVLEKLMEALEFLVKCANKVGDIIIALVKKLYNENIKPVFEKIYKAITNNAIFKKAKELWASLVKVVTDVIKKIKELWNKFLSWLGISTEKDLNVDANVKIDVDTSELDTTLESFNGSSVNGGTVNKQIKVKEEVVAGSLKDIQTQISDVNKQITLIDPNDSKEIERLKSKLEQLQKQEYLVKLKLGLETGKIDIEKQIQYITDEVKDIDIQIAGIEQQITVTTDEDELVELQKQLQGLKDYRVSLTCNIKGTEDFEELISIQKKITDIQQQITVVTEDSGLAELEEQLQILKDNRVSLTCSVNGAEEIDSLIELQKKITDIQQQITVVTEDSGLAELEEQLQILKDNRVSLTCSVSGADEIEELNELDKRITDIQQQITVVTEDSGLAELEEQLQILKDKEISLTCNVNGAEEIDSLIELQKRITDIEQQITVVTEDSGLAELEEQLQILKDKEIYLKCNVSGADEIEELNELDKRITDIQQQITVVTEDSKLKDLRNELSELKDKEVTVKTNIIKTQTVKNEFEKGSLKDIQKQISDLNEQLHIVDPTNVEEIQRINDELAKLKQQEKDIKLILRIDVDTSPVNGSLAFVEKKISELQGKLKVVDPNNKQQIEEINSQLKDLLKQKYEIEVKLGLNKEEAKKTFSQITSEISSGIKTAYGYADSIKSIGDKLNELKDNEDTTAWDWISFAAEAASKLIETIGGVSKALEAMGVITQSTSAIQSAASKQAQADNTAETATEIALTSAESGEAIAGATKSGAKLPFPLNIAAIAAGIAAVVGALAMIASFKDGGIVGRAQNGMICSGSYCGDKNLVRVNGGEMILNGTQQASLFRLLNNGGIATGSSINGKVSFEISGKNLKGVLDNYNNKISKVK